MCSPHFMHTISRRTYTDFFADDWGVPPNFLIVDYYNYGDPGPGSVFEVAARANGVEYNRACCGAQTSAAPKPMAKGSSFALAVASVATVFSLWA